MKLYACYTPSHLPLVNQHFLLSLPPELGGARSSHMFSNKKAILRELPQRSQSGAFESPGFQATCLDKVDFIIEALKTETEPFLFSDVDVRFYGPVVDDLTKLLGDADMAFQWDGESGLECSGFMVLRPCGAVLSFWNFVRQRMVDHSMMDQDAVHSVLGPHDQERFSKATQMWFSASAKWRILPERYWTFGRNDKHWTPGMPVNPPADLLVHHANWTVGVDNKLKLLDEVKRFDDARRAGAVGYATPNAKVAAEIDAVAATAKKPLYPFEEGTRARFRCKECGHEHLGGEPCCGHGDACQEVQAVTYAVPDHGKRIDTSKAVSAGYRYPGLVTGEDGISVIPKRMYVDGGAPGAAAFQARQAKASGEYATLDDDGERMLPYSEVTRMLEDQRRRLTGPRHHPLPLALVLQFWKGDKRRALDLARLIADIEPLRRTDPVCFVFARQDNCPMDAEIEETMLYVGMKMPVMDLVTTIDERKHYPGVCFDAWASACRQLSDAYHTGRLPYGNAFFFEADGCPIGSDWIDRLKHAHEETLLLGKRVTGPLMRFGGVDSVHQVGGHVNGTLALHLSCWDDYPSLHRCPPTVAWDVFHGLALRNEAGPSQIIANHHGGRALSQEMYWEFGKEHAFVTSIKDGTPQHWCRLGITLEQEKRERQASNG